MGAGATTAATYDYGYGRPAAATYETPKTYYQQPAAATYSTTDYQQGVYNVFLFSKICKHLNCRINIDVFRN